MTTRRISFSSVLILAGIAICVIAGVQFMAGYNSASAGGDTALADLPIHDHSSHDPDGALDIVEIGSESADDHGDDHGEDHHVDEEAGATSIGTVNADVLSEWVSHADIDAAMVRFGASEEDRADVQRILLAQAVFAQASRDAGLDAPADDNASLALAYERQLRERLAPTAEEVQALYDETFTNIAGERSDVMPFEEAADLLAEAIVTARIDEHYIELLTTYELLAA